VVIGSHLLDALLADGETGILGVDTNADGIAHHGAGPGLSLVRGATAEPRLRAALEAEIPGPMRSSTSPRPATRRSTRAARGLAAHLERSRRGVPRAGL
jgi:hypothetical protein